MKSILVIGIGKFGHHFAKKLIALGNEVMIIDQDEDKIRELMSKATSARIGDCTDEDVLNNLGLSNFDTVAVCISENFQNSIETTSLVKELGAKHVISVASRDIHAKLLLKNGADEVIYPDRDIAYRLAKKYSRSHVFEYIELSDEYAIFEVPVIPQLVGKSIREADVRKKYKMNIIGIVHGEDVQIMPSADYRFSSDEHIKVISDNDSVDAYLKHVK